MWNNVPGIELLQWNMEHGNYNGIWVIEIKDETQLSIEFLPPNNGNKKCLKKYLVVSNTQNFWTISLVCFGKWA